MARNLNIVKRAASRFAPMPDIIRVQKMGGVALCHYEFFNGHIFYKKKKTNKTTALLGNETTPEATSKTKKEHRPCKY